MELVEEYIPAGWGSTQALPDMTERRSKSRPLPEFGQMTDGELLERFLSRRDEAAFESVVLRHGPMVLRLCREVLGNPHDAEDAFQATFLVLVNNAGAIRDRDSLGRWLYGVAYRVAIRAKSRVRKRQAQERQGVEMAAAGPGYDAAQQELLPLLHSELNRLPAKIRDPMVLCYLEGHSQEEAARQLACPLGTLKGRLTKGRELLRSRLSRRGVGVSLVLLVLAMLEEGASGAIPDALLDATVRAALRLAAVNATSGPSSAGQFGPLRSRRYLPHPRWLALLVLVLGLAIGIGSLGHVQGKAATRIVPVATVTPPPVTTAASPPAPSCGAVTMPPSTPQQPQQKP